MRALAVLLACVLCVHALLSPRGDAQAGGGGQPAARAPLWDAHGDPLPRGAVARLGPLRWRITGAAWSLSFSPDGKRLVSSDRHSVRLWDVASGEELGSAAIPEVARTAFTHDGQRILLAAEWKLVLLDGHNGKELGSYPIDGAAFHVLPHPTESYAAVVTNRGGIYIVRSDRVAPDSVRRLTLFRGSFLSAAAWAPDGKILAVADTGGRLGGLHLLDVSAGGRVVRDLRLPGRPRDLMFAPDGKALVLKDQGATLWVDAATGRKVRAFTPHLRATGWWLSPDGRQLVVGQTGTERRVQVWDTQTGKLLHAHRRKLVTYGRGLGLAFSPDGKVGADTDGRLLRLWDVRTGKPLSADAGHRGPVEQLRFLADGRQVVTHAADGLAALWDAATGKLVRELRHNDERSARVGNGLPADGSFLVTRAEGGLSVWDVAAGKAKCWPVPAEGYWAPGDVAASGKTVVVGTTAGVVLWDVKAGKERQRLSGPAPFGVLQLSPDERRLAEFSENVLAVWDVETGKCLWRLEDGPRKDSFRVVVWSPDGRQLLVERGFRRPGDDLLLLNADTGQRQGRLVSEDHGIQSVVFSPDGRLTATASVHGVVRLWETASWLPLGHFTLRRPGSGSGPGQDYGHARLAFDPTGLRLAAAVDDGSVLVHSLPLLFAGRDGKPDEKAWDVLAGGDGKAAFALMMSLTQRPAEAVALFRKHLAPAVGVPARRVQELLAELSARDFARRRAASRELINLGDLAEGALREVVKNKPSLEAERRAGLVLRALDERPRHFPSPSARVARALQVLEAIGDRAAREVLEGLARGDPRSRQTRQAQDALERLKRRGGKGAPNNKVEQR
jgi:WD40 repeat protein